MLKIFKTEMLRALVLNWIDSEEKLAGDFQDDGLS